MTYVYVYRLISDTGLAPCVLDGLLSLAVCKGGKMYGDKIVHTGLRYWIGSKAEKRDYTVDEVYILGAYKGKFLYMAKVTKVVTMMEYFDGMANGRMDNIYTILNGKPIRNNHLRKEQVHLEADRKEKDFAGKYVLLSDDFIYLGRDAVENALITEHLPVSRETRIIEGDKAEKLVRECRKYKDDKVHLPNSPFSKKTHCGGCK